MTIRTVCVFCGARHGRDPSYRDVARALGHALAERGLTLVYGGGSVGLMGDVADAALAAGGYVVGVIPLHLCNREVLHPRLSQLHTTADLMDRKRVMMDVADAFIALPGGLGTFDEILEVMTWRQLGRHHKPCGLVDHQNYFQPFLASMRHAVECGFLDDTTVADLVVAADPLAVLDSVVPVRGAST